MRAQRSPFTQNFDQLPQSLAIFPLQDVVLLPGGNLPLNIFEPRYLNMVQDAMQGSRLIGMIQPRHGQEPSELCEVGCAGRITHYRETADARLEIVLTGICRFRILQEIPTTRGYRLVQPDWSPFAGDYEQPVVDDGQMKSFHEALRQYLAEQSIDLDWELMDKLEAEALVSSLAMALPLAASDKQLLLEAPDLEKRVQLFGALVGSAQHAGDTRH